VTELTLDGRRLAALFPEGVVAREAEPALAHVDALFEEERAQIARAVDKRRAEYATARELARAAMAELGVARVPIVNAEDRAPLWPEGVVGSITHTKGYCGVVVARRGAAIESIGVDVEVSEPVKVALHDKICSERELAWIARVAASEEEQGRLVKLTFSAKEAFYKAQYPLTKQYLGFHDVELDLDLEGGRFAVELRREAGRFARGARLEGRLTTDARLVVAALAFDIAG
jgi:4'-phosphopantetheinyl transferase EntD